MPEVVTLGWQVAHWIETLLCHGPGDVQGQPVDLDEEWLAVLARAYRLDPKTGRRTVDRYLLSRPKGRAKSELAGFVTCAEGLGPVRFSHFAKRGETSWWGYEYEKGEPVGRTVTSPFIRILATEETQTGNTYDVVEFVLQEAPIAEQFDLDVGRTRTFLPGNGEIRPSTAGSASKDGGKESFAVADEVHLYVLPELKRMFDTVSRNATKRKDSEPWMLSTTTMFRPGEESIAEVEWNHKEEIAAGRAKPDPSSVLDHREGPEPRNWNDDRQLRTSLRKGYGPAAEWMDLDRIIREIRRPTTDPADARRYFLNRHAPVVADGWLKDYPGVWDRCSEPDLGLLDCTEFVGAVDMSLRYDTTAVVWVGRHPTGRVVVRLTLFSAAPNGKIDYVAVKTELLAGSLLGAKRVAYDPRLFELMAQELEDLGVKMVEFPQSPERMAPACGHLLELVLGVDLAHDGDETLRAHVHAAAKRPTGDRGFTLSKSKSKAPIDGAVATAMACWELAHPPAEKEAPDLW